MGKEISLTLSLVFALLGALAFAVQGSAVAQNMSMGGSNVTTTATNMTNATTTGDNATGANMTAPDDSSGSAKTHLEEGIKALQAGDNQGAMTHLTAAQEAMSNAPPAAIKHFDEGMKALESGDNGQALMHLEAANEALG